MLGTSNALDTIIYLYIISENSNLYLAKQPISKDTLLGVRDITMNNQQETKVIIKYVINE